MEKILILGGTNFIGRNLVEQLIALKEFDVTLFNRQRTNKELFPEVSRIKGDRETTDIERIGAEHWDYVIDLSCYYPEVLARTLSVLQNVRNYVFISTCSVYDHDTTPTPLKDEWDSTLKCSPVQSQDRSVETYGNRKAECERVLQGFGFPYVILRPALVFGPYDPTDRLYYWLYQIKEESQLLLPENGERLFSITYVMDLVNFIVNSLKEEASGTYNVISQPQTSIQEIVTLTSEVLKTGVRVTNAPSSFLNSNNISPWIDIPLWLNSDGYTYSNKKMIQNTGMEITPMKVALNETILYYEWRRWPMKKVGISEEQSKKLIDKLHVLGQSEYIL